jgi:hypothetical protein
VVVACFEKFVETINQTTYVLIDSDFFLAHFSFCTEKGLYIKPLAAISPDLNIIEILWRKIKSDGMHFNAT